MAYFTLLLYFVFHFMHYRLSSALNFLLTYLLTQVIARTARRQGQSAAGDASGQQLLLQNHPPPLLGHPQQNQYHLPPYPWCALFHE